MYTKNNKVKIEFLISEDFENEFMYYDNSSSKSKATFIPSQRNSIDIENLCVRFNDYEKRMTTFPNSSSYYHLHDITKIVFAVNKNFDDDSYFLTVIVSSTKDVLCVISISLPYNNYDIKIEFEHENASKLLLVDIYKSKIKKQYTIESE